MTHTHTTATAFFTAARAVLETAPLDFPPAGPSPSFTEPLSTFPVRRDGPAGRFYDVPRDGVVLPYVSVTHALTCLNKPALVNWAADQERTYVLDAAATLYADASKLPSPLPRTSFLATLAARLGQMRAHQRALTKAGDIGQQTHDLIARELRQRLGQRVSAAPKVTAEAERAYAGWQQWARSVALRPKAVEQIVYSHQHKYAGTMDLLADVNDVETLVDFKTGKAVYGEAHLQNVAYRAAHEEMGHGPAPCGIVVRLPKRATDPPFEVVEVAPVTSLLPTFLAVLQVWAWWYQQESAGRAQRRSIAIAARRLGAA